MDGSQTPNDSEQSPESNPEANRLRELVHTHRGKLSEMAKDLGVTRQAVSRQLAKHHLQEEADRERALGGIRGPRSTLRSGSVDPDGERKSLLEVLAATDSYEAAAKRAGISRRTLFRRIDQLKITPGAVKRYRQQHAKSA